jgi:hypothetical protein
MAIRMTFTLHIFSKSSKFDPIIHAPTHIFKFNKFARPTWWLLSIYVAKSHPIYHTWTQIETSSLQQKKVSPNGYSLASSLLTRLAYLGRGWIFSSSTNLFITTFFPSQFKPCEVFLISIHFFHLEEPTLEAITRFGYINIYNCKSCFNYIYCFCCCNCSWYFCLVDTWHLSFLHHATACKTFNKLMSQMEEKTNYRT